MNTLLLDPQTWDLTTDATGNIAVASDPLSIAQDVASACRLFQGELWYDTTQGMPYFQSVLGKSPPLSFIAAKLQGEGSRVPEVVSIKVALNPVGSDRILNKPAGTLTITDNRGTTTTIGIGSSTTPWYVQAVTPGGVTILTADGGASLTADDGSTVLTGP